MPSASKKRNNKSKQNTYKRKNTQEASGTLTKEIIIIALFVFAFLIFISNFGIGGKFTEGLSNFFFGLFGISAYIFPIIMGAILFYIAAAGRIKCSKSKIIAISLVFILISSFAQLIDSGNSGNYGFADLFTYAKREHLGGGILGGAIYKLFHTAVGTVGLVIINIFIAIVAGILFTGKSVLDMLFNKGEDIKNNRQKVLETRNSKRREVYNDNSIENEKHKKDFVFPVFDGYEPNMEGVVEADPIVKSDSVVGTHAMDSDSETKKKTRSKRKQKAVEDSNFGDNVFEPEFDSKVIKDTILEKTSEPVATEPAERVERRRKQRAGVEEIKESEFNQLKQNDDFKLPPIDMLVKNECLSIPRNDNHLRETALNLQNTFKSFGIKIQITDVTCGPAVTRYEFRPEAGVKVNKILSLTDDIKLNLAVSDLRIEAPVPGKAAIGIEVPSATKTPVLIRDLLEAEEMINNKSLLTFPVGKDVSGKVIVADLAKMPHMLISGTTGSGKSVLTNSILITFLFRCKPEDVRFIIIDPKVVEFSVYNGIPNLIIPVVTDPKKAAGALNWAVAEMDDRYKKFSELNVRDLESYNRCIEEKQYELLDNIDQESMVKLPKIVIIIDELADLMMVAAKEVEEAICRLAQKARAAGIHMIIATQRPSVDVITGLIKANVPSRVALTVASGTDSRTIIDMNGAEKLLGKGDMLFAPSDYPKPLRVQGSFVSDNEIADVVKFLKEESESNGYDEDVMKIINTHTVGSGSLSSTEQGSDDGRDELFWEAGRLICDKQKASIGSLQRCFRIGFNRAARIMDQLFEANVVGPEQGTKPREILMSLEDFELLYTSVTEDEA